jgi:hypothetical protein
LQKVKWVESSTAGYTKQEIKKEEIPHTICINGANHSKLSRKVNACGLGRYTLATGYFACKSVQVRREYLLGLHAEPVWSAWPKKANFSTSSQG